MVYRINIVFVIIMAIFCIDDTGSVLMYVYAIGRDSGADRLLCNSGLHPCWYISESKTRIFTFDRDAGGLGSLVKAV